MLEVCWTLQKDWVELIGLQAVKFGVTVALQLLEEG
jgi:hypothetical protein